MDVIDKIIADFTARVTGDLTFKSKISPVHKKIMFRVKDKPTVFLEMKDATLKQIYPAGGFLDEKDYIIVESDEATLERIVSKEASALSVFGKTLFIKASLADMMLMKRLL